MEIAIVGDRYTTRGSALCKAQGSPSLTIRIVGNREYVCLKVAGFLGERYEVVLDAGDIDRIKALEQTDRDGNSNP